MQFYVRFVEKIIPDPQTGKKKLIVSKYGEGRNRHERDSAAGPRALPPRRVERQPVGETVADQWLGKIIQAGQINAILTSFDDIHVIEQQHPLRWVCLHAQC